MAFDVADPEASAQALATLLEAGPIQVLVNNAGIHDDAPMAGMSAAQWHKVIDVSLHGFFHVTQPLLAADGAHALGAHRQRVLGGGGAG